MKIGILALQGAIEPHKAKLRELGATPVEVRLPEDLKGLSGIILPGGESTAMIHLLKLNKLWEPLKQFVEKRPVWGVCAGAILLASKVTHPEQDCLKRLDVTADRNAYGRQIDSFIGSLAVTSLGRERLSSDRVEGVFIRAPRFADLGAGVVSLVTSDGEPVMVEQGKCLASAFHPELSQSNLIHEYFLSFCKGEQPWTIDFPSGSESSLKN